MSSEQKKAYRETALTEALDVIEFRMGIINTAVGTMMLEAARLTKTITGLNKINNAALEKELEQLRSTLKTIISVITTDAHLLKSNTEIVSRSTKLIKVKKGHKDNLIKPDVPTHLQMNINLPEGVSVKMFQGKLNAEERAQCGLGVAIIFDPESEEYLVTKSGNLRAQYHSIVSKIRSGIFGEGLAQSLTSKSNAIWGFYPCSTDYCAVNLKRTIFALNPDDTRCQNHYNRNK